MPTTGAIMEDLEGALAACRRRRSRPAGASSPAAPYERLTVRDAVLRETGDRPARSARDGRGAARGGGGRAGVRVGGARRLRRRLLPPLPAEGGAHAWARSGPRSSSSTRRSWRRSRGSSRATPRWRSGSSSTPAGVELANGFSELTDAVEQRRRLVEEQALRAPAGRPVYPLDERFLEAVGRMPPSGGDRRGARPGAHAAARRRGHRRGAALSCAGVRVIRDLFRTGFTFGTAAVLTPAMGTAADALSALDRGYANAVIRAWARSILSAAAVRHRGIGLEKRAAPRRCSSPTTSRTSTYPDLRLPGASAVRGQGGALPHPAVRAGVEGGGHGARGPQGDGIGSADAHRGGGPGAGRGELDVLRRGARSLDGILRPFKKGRR